MSFFSDLSTFWQANSTLNTALPWTTSVWIDAAPPGSEQNPPFAVLTQVASVPVETVEPAYVSQFLWQIAVYHTSAATAESLGNTIVGQINDAQIGTGSARSFVNNYYTRKDSSTPVTLYRCLIEFQLWKNKNAAI